MSRERNLVMEIEVAGRTFYAEEEILTLIGDEAKILDAYFAEKKIENVEEAAGTHTYTFANTNDTSTPFKKNIIASVILNKVNKDEKSNKKYTTQALVRAQLTLESYTDGNTIAVDLLKSVEKISYPKITSAPMGYQVYLIAETQNLKDKKVKLKIHEKESDLKLLKTKDDVLPVLIFAKKEDTTTNTEASDWIEIDVKEENGKKEGNALVLHKEDKCDTIEVGIKKIQLRPKEDKIKTEGEDAALSFEGWQEALYIREDEPEEGKKAIEDAKALAQARKNETFITLSRDADADKKENKKSFPKEITGPKTISIDKDAVYTLDSYEASATEDDKKNIRWSFYVQGDPITTIADKEKTYIDSKSKAGWYTYAKSEIVNNKNQLTLVFDEALIGKKVQIEAFRGSPDINSTKDYVRTTTVQKKPIPKITKRETTSLWLTSQCDSVENAGEMIDKEFKNYFKLETPGLLFPFRTIPLNHPDGFKNNDYKVWNYRLHETKAPTFGYERDPGMRIHAARDLYYEVNEPIYAIFDGVVKRKKLFYLDTWVIEIEHDFEYKKGCQLVVRYGEVNKNNILVNVGDRVKRGQPIAEIGLLYNSKKKTYIVQPSPDKRGMLHIEMYTGEESGALSDSSIKYIDMLYAKSTKYSSGRSFKRRKDLFDPLTLLDKMYLNSKKEGLMK